MYNYHNIIPIILIHVLIIILFEGIIFYLYLFKMEEKLITDKLIKITNELKNNINIKTNQLMEKLNPETINISPEIPSNANTLINNKKEKLLNAMKKDEEVNFNNNKYGMKIFIGLIVSIILSKSKIVSDFNSSYNFCSTSYFLSDSIISNNFINIIQKLMK